jgi:hypothetical protein
MLQTGPVLNIDFSPDGQPLSSPDAQGFDLGKKSIYNRSSFTGE